MDYNYYRSDFYYRNKYRDIHMNYGERRYTPGLENYTLIKINNNEEDPCGVSGGLFVLFTLIPFVEFYKCYIDSFCVYQEFTVRKLVSTRYDLNAQVYQQKYLLFTSSIEMYQQQYVFEP